MPHLQAKFPASLYVLSQNPTGSPPVLLLHGLGATGASWGLQIPALVKAGFLVLAPDMRGFGKSPYPGQTNIAGMTSDMAELLRIRQTYPAHVVGISMGGTIALQLALEDPRLVRKLVLVNTFARLRPDRLSVWLFFAFRMLLIHTLGLPAQAQVVGKRIFPDSVQQETRQVLIDQILQANPRAYRATMRSLARFNVSNRLNEITMPTLVITGENDNTVPLKNQRELAEGIPGARHVIIRSAGHAVIADQPDAFNKTMLDFLCG
jgi:3-oxoadipate enol-lactonase